MSTVAGLDALPAPRRGAPGPDRGSARRERGPAGRFARVALVVLAAAAVGPLLGLVAGGLDGLMFGTGWPSPSPAGQWLHVAGRLVRDPVDPAAAYAGVAGGRPAADAAAFWLIWGDLMCLGSLLLLGLGAAERRLAARPPGHRARPGPP